MHIRSSWLILLSFFWCMACSDSPEPLVRVVDQGMPLVEDMATDESEMSRVPFVVGELPVAPTQDLVVCGGPRLGLDLNVCTASYLGGAGADRVTQVAISPDGSIVLGGMFPGVNGFGPLNNEFGFGGDGAVVKLDETGRLIQAWSSVGSLISALDVSPRDGMVVVGGSFGLMGLEAGMASQAFTVATSAPEMLDVGFDGEVGWFAGKRVTIYGPETDQVLGSFDVEVTQVTDLVVDSWNQRVVLTGFKQVSGDLQQPFVNSYNFDGGVIWSAWGWSAEQAQGLGSDTRGKALAIGYDGALYFAGEAHGGETVFKRSPRDVTAMQSLFEQDEYAKTSNLNGGAPVGFVARLNLGTGAMEAGTFLVTRLESGKGNAARPTSIAANERGEIVVAGESACCIKNGEAKKVMGQPAMPGYAGGAFVAVFDGATFERKLWTTLHGGANAAMRDVDAWGGAAVVVQEHVSEQDASALEDQMILHNSFFEVPQGGSSDVHITVIPMP